MSDATKRPPGRPRSESAQIAVLEEARRSVAEAGYSGTTIDEIAARAGVGKQTIYRRWPTKADLILAACAPEADFQVPVPDEGSYAADLRSFLRVGHEMANRPQTADLLRSLMVEAQIRPDFGERFRRTFLEPRRRAFATITDHAADRGDLPSSPAPEIAAEIVFGTLWYRLLATHEELDDRLVEDLVATLTGRP